MLTEQSMTDTQSDFTSESIALGYHPFIRFSPLEFYAIHELYGDFAFGEIFPRLKDPGKLHPSWAARFVHAASTLPKDEIQAAVDLHAYVTSSEIFKERRILTKKFDKALHLTFSKFKDGEITAPEPALVVYLADVERWKFELKNRWDAQQLENKKRAEKKVRRLATQAIAVKKKADLLEKAEEAAKKPTPKPTPKQAEPIIERKSASSPQKSTVPTPKGVWRNPNSEASAAVPQAKNPSQPVTIIRRREEK